MRVPLIKDGVVVNVIELADDAEIVSASQLKGKIAAKEDVSKCWVPPEGCIVGPEGGEIGDTWDGLEYSSPPPPANPPPTVEDYERVITRHIDLTARARSYRSAESCASYVNSSYPVWAAEAAAFIAWRDAVWLYAFQELEKVQNGQRTQPTLSEFLEELPTIKWPA